MAEAEQRPDWDAVRRKLASGEGLDVIVSDVYHRGGLLAVVDGIVSFVPLSQVLELKFNAAGEVDPDGVLSMVGRILDVRVIEVNERRNRVILSERELPAQKQPSA